ncbi:unknown [Methanoculleus sp. CAG:1088]|nr:unknown [Methanoculleus sp. CAG:1088]
MTALSKLVLDKINSMDISESRKKAIIELFESQWRIGSDSKLKKERISDFRKILAKGANNEDN